MNSSHSPHVDFRMAIVGRPNVGKSTLFNRLFGRKRALVHDLPGVTRDRLEERTEWKWGGKKYTLELVDTGGIGGDLFADEIKDQVRRALRTVHVVLVVVDSQKGITPQDRDVVRELRMAGIDGKKVPVIGVVNKVDADSHEDRIHDFYDLGLDPILTISAEHGRGIDALKQSVLDLLEERGVLAEQEEALVDEPANTSEAEEEFVPRIPRVAIVGRPNVGKSTLVNAILGEKRMITSPIAGTTVDSVDSPAELQGREILLIDTAGIRRKSRTEQGVEVLSVVQAKKALERCDVAVLVLDGEGGITDQDEKIGGLIEEQGCSVILAINKWDTQANTKGFTRDVAAEIVRKEMAFLRYAPLLFMSAKRGKGFEKLGELIEEILEQRRVKPSTKEFTEWVRKAATIHNPKNAKFYMCHQSGRNPPTFVCHVSDPDKVHFSLKRHLINGIRERWGYMGSPVRLLFVKGGSRKAGA